MFKTSFTNYVTLGGRGVSIYCGITCFFKEINFQMLGKNEGMVLKISILKIPKWSLLTFFRQILHFKKNSIDS